MAGDAPALKEVGARIVGTILGFEDHGIFTFNIKLDYGWGGQFAGGFVLGNARGYATNGLKLLDMIMKVANVDKWEDLPGRPVYALVGTSGIVEGLASFPGARLQVVFSEVLSQ